MRYHAMKTVAFVPGARRQMLKLSADVRGRIEARLAEFAEHGTGDVRRLSGLDGSRLRVGDWRVIFYEEGEMIIVSAVGHRREVYK